jgi:hypothetical protein
MKRFVLCLILVSYGSNAQTEHRSADPTSQRESKLFQLGMLYGIDITKNGWHLQNEELCPQFKRHTFATLFRADKLGVITSYTVIYSLAPVVGGQRRSENDGIVLLRTGIGSEWTQGDVAQQNSTVNIFNKIWGDELKHSGRLHELQSIDWGGLAKCYARIAGQEPLASSGSGQNSPGKIGTQTNRIDGIVLRTQDLWSRTGTLAIEFDSVGMVRKGGVYSFHESEGK